MRAVYIISKLTQILNRSHHDLQDLITYDDHTQYYDTANTRPVNHINSGLDAAKPASPAAGDVYMATDTAILYNCHTAGTWDALTAVTKTVTTLTGSGNFTVPTGFIRGFIDAWGAGGGGRGGNPGGSPGNGGAGGDGGNAGSHVKQYIDSYFPGDVIPYSVGAGGSGGASGSQGNAGGNTTFGSITANGGAAQTGTTGAPGNLLGIGGTAGSDGTPVGSGGAAGQGAQSAGAVGGSGGNATGNGAGGGGGGGGGGVNSGSGGAGGAGGNGSDGILTITYYTE